MPILRRKNNISICYERIDETHGAEVVVLTSVLTRDHTILRKLIPMLKQHYQLILLDNRDAGQSSVLNTEYDIADMADDVVDLLKHLAFPSYHIVGHSMGEFMAIHIAAKQPELVKTLALCSTTEKQVQAAIEYLNARIISIDSQPSDTATTASEHDVRAVMDKIYSADSLQDRRFVEEIVRHETSNPHPQSAASFKRQAVACMRHDASALLSQISCPTFVVTGEKDKYYTPDVAQHLASQLQHAQISIVPHAGHIIQIEQPVFFCDTLNKFIHQNKNQENLTCKL